MHLAAFARHTTSDLCTTVAWPQHGPTILLCWHVATLALVVFTTVFELVGPDSLAPGYYDRFFAYLTNWTWWLLGARAITGAAVCTKGRGGGAKVDGASAFGYTPLHKVFAVLSAILPTASVIVTVGYWAAVREVGGRIFLDEPIKHGANAAVLLTEVVISRLPITTTWVVFPVGYLAVYTIFQVIYWAGSEKWVYGRTDFRDCVILPGYFLLPIVAAGVFFLMCDPPHTSAPRPMQSPCHRVLLAPLRSAQCICLLKISLRCVKRAQRFRACRYSLAALRNRLVKPREAPTALRWRNGLENASGQAQRPSGESAV